VKFNTSSESPNVRLITDEDIRVMLKDHLSVNSTVVVNWDEQGRAVVRGSKTEGGCSHVPPHRCAVEGVDRLGTDGGRLSAVLCVDYFP
jgi:hypothetical protein